MSTTGRLTSAVAATAFAVMIGTSGFAQQDKDQQGCINAVNKDAAKVGQAQGKENSACVKTGSKGPVTATCPTDDLKGKVGKKTAKTLADETSKCTTAPGFAYTSGANANGAFQQSELDLLSDMFGGTDLSGVIVADKDTGGCQAAVTKDVGKLAAAASKAFVSCKKTALKGGTVTATDVQNCVGDDTKGKVVKSSAKLGSDIGKKCGAATIATAFPGACSASTAGTLGGCLTARAKCRVCLAANDADGLSADCDTIDDGLGNSSCGAPAGCPLAAGLYTTSQVAGGTLDVYGFAPFPFPAGGFIKQDVAAASLPDCVHDTVVPFVALNDPGNGFFAPNFCVPALNLITNVKQTGCGVGRIDSNGGSDFDTNEVADTSAPSAPCSLPASCVNGANSNLRVDITVGLGGPDVCTTGTQNALVTVPVHTTSWHDNSPGTFGACVGDGIQDGTDTVIATFDQILDFTTATAKGSWADTDPDGCSLAGLGPSGGYATVPADSSCIDATKVNTAMVAVNTVAVGEFGSTGGTFDGSFMTKLPNTVAGPAAPLGAVCASPPLINYTGTAIRCIP